MEKPDCQIGSGSFSTQRPGFSRNFHRLYSRQNNYNLLTWPVTAVHCVRCWSKWRIDTVRCPPRCWWMATTPRCRTSNRVVGVVGRRRFATSADGFVRRTHQQKSHSLGVCLLSSRSIQSRHLRRCDTEYANPLLRFDLYGRFGIDPRDVARAVRDFEAQEQLASDHPR